MSSQLLHVNTLYQLHRFYSDKSKAIINYESDNVWKEPAVAYFKALSRYLWGGLRNPVKILCQDSRSPGSDPNSVPPVYIAMLAGIQLVKKLASFNEPKR